MQVPAHHMQPTCSMHTGKRKVHHRLWILPASDTGDTQRKRTSKNALPDAIQSIIQNLALILDEYDVAIKGKIHPHKTDFKHTPHQTCHDNRLVETVFRALPARPNKPLADYPC